MKIENFSGNPGEVIKSTIHADRFVNDGSPSGEHRSVSSDFSPMKGLPSFSLSYRRIPDNEVKIFTSTSSSKPIHDLLINKSDGFVNFYVHPDMQVDYPGVNKGEVEVIPTSSGRTVYVVPKASRPSFLKLHYDGLLGRSIRVLNEGKINQSMRTSEELSKLYIEGKQPLHFSFLPETAGVVTQIGGKEIGYIVREYLTPGIAEEQIPKLIPWFSLFSKDMKKPEDPTLLKQWIQILGQEYGTPSVNFFDHFVNPLIDTFCYLADKAGFAIDYNAQNLLVLADDNLKPKGIILRDLQSGWADIDKRRQNGQTTTNFTKAIDVCSKDELARSYAYKLRSLYFDFRFFSYVVAPVVKEFCASFGGDFQKVIGQARERLLSKFPNIKEYFYPYEEGYCLPPGITKKDENGRSILALGTKSSLR